MKTAVLSTDTLHHRYFINELRRQQHELAALVLEEKGVEPPFEVGPFFRAEEDQFETETMFSEFSTEWALKNIISFEHINTSEAIEYFKQGSFDFAVVFGTRRIKPEVIALFKHGLINVHRGIAQEYRGLDSDLWAIYHRDYENLGVTIHRVTAELDTGEIVGQQHMPLKKDMKIFQIRGYTTQIATQLVSNALSDFKTGKLVSRPQEKFGRYYSFMPLVMKEQMGRRFGRHCAKLKDD